MIKLCDKLFHNIKLYKLYKVKELSAWWCFTLGEERMMLRDTSNLKQSIYTDARFCLSSSLGLCMICTLYPCGTNISGELDNDQLLTFTTEIERRIIDCYIHK